MTDQLGRTLDEMGHETSRVITGDRARKHPNRLNPENIVAVAQDALAVWRATRRIRPDLVWLHTIGVPLLPAIRTAVLALAARLGGARLVVQFHAFDVRERIAGGGWALHAMLWLIGRLSRVIVALHQSDGRALERAGGAQKVAVLANWVEVNGSPPPLAPTPPLRAVYVGGLIARKGLPELLDAARLLDGAPVVIRIVGGAGDEGEEAAQRYRASAADLVDRGLVTFAGELDADGVRHELGDAHVLVLPSRAEGTPRAVLESLAEARPVVVTDVGDVGAIVRAGECGSVLPSGDAPQIAACLSDLSRDEALVRMQSANAHRYAVENLSSESRHGDIEAILRRASA
jgi:glycosyltransferase involved in cell wall biosynthesis